MSKEHGADARPVLLIRTISFSFALLLLIALGVFAARMWQTTDVLSKQGSRGNEVRQIQQKLKNWGYYFGEVDGIFGVQTKKAVMDFQRKNGLAVDGIAGNATLRAMGIYSSQQTSGSGGYSDSDIALLANIISAEARGEPFEGQVAVGAVVLNRVEDSRFPDTVKGVITQPGQYSTKYATVEAANAIQATDSKNGTYYYGICEDSVKAAMMGQVEMPSNVLYQANFSQGKGVWKSVYFNSGWYASTSYFCYG